MGTNYYAVTGNVCPTCGRGDEDTHIGKSSVGWPFLLAPRFSTWREWRSFLLSGVKIKDEYGREETPERLINLVESKRDTPTHYHSSERPDDWEYRDEDGYRISKTEGFT